jgi:predicted signal transduction protein with EAL and GGDEF domain
LLALGRDLGLAVIAEGVERASQAQVLRRLQCPFAQGFLFRRPAAADEVQPYVLGQRPTFFVVEPGNVHVPEARVGRSVTAAVRPAG